MVSFVFHHNYILKIDFHSNILKCAIYLASIREMSGEVWRDSPGEYQADERAGVARLTWRVSGR